MDVKLDRATYAFQCLLCCPQAVCMFSWRTLDGLTWIWRGRNFVINKEKETVEMSQTNGHLRAVPG